MARNGFARADVGLNAVIISVDGTTPRLLTVEGHPHQEGLPSGHLDDAVDRTLEQGVRRLVSHETGLPVRYFEQLYTFGDRNRVPGGRSLAVAYLALVRHQDVRGPSSPSWRSCYELFPWEDWREGQPAVLDTKVVPALERWLALSPPSDLPTRQERAELTFGIGHARWDPVRVLDRYELIYELRLVGEAAPEGDRPGPGWACRWPSTIAASRPRRWSGCGASWPTGRSFSRCYRILSPCPGFSRWSKLSPARCSTNKTSVAWWPRPTLSSPPGNGTSARAGDRPNCTVSAGKSCGNGRLRA